MPLGAAPQQAAAPAVETSLPFDLRPRVERASLALRRPTLQALYQAIAETYGIRLLFDRDVEQTRQVGDLHLQDATLQEALEAAGSVSRTFVAPVDEQTGLVAADTSDKRAQYERQVLASFPLDAQSTPQQLTEISTALRTLLDLRRVAQDNRSFAIGVRGRPRQVSAATAFVETLQKEAGEVRIEVETWEVDSRRARELGLLPPPSFHLLFLGASGAAAVPLSALGQGRTLYGVRLPGATGSLTFSSSVVQSHQKLQLRASQGQPASLLVGDRFPVAVVLVSSSLLPSTGTPPSPTTPGLFPTIRYEDLGVVLKTTPYFHAGRELTLALDLAVRSLSGRDLNGLPIISNRQITGQVRLREGEGYLIAGILKREDTRSRSGFPWLSRLPLMGWLFGRRGQQKRETEMLILIRPYILRSGPAQEFASRPIFFGREPTGLPAVVEPPPTPPQPPGVPPAVPGVPGVPVPQPGVPQVLPPGVPQPGVPPEVPQPEGVPPTPEEPQQ